MGGKKVPPSSLPLSNHATPVFKTLQCFSAQSKSQSPSSGEGPQAHLCPIPSPWAGCPGLPSLPGITDRARHSCPRALSSLCLEHSSPSQMHSWFLTSLGLSCSVTFSVWPFLAPCLKLPTPLPYPTSLLDFSSWHL